MEKWNVAAFPTLYIIDAKGVIRSKIVGGGPVAEKKIAELVAKLLKEADGKSEQPRGCPDQARSRSIPIGQEENPVCSSWPAFPCRRGAPSGYPLLLLRFESGRPMNSPPQCQVRLEVHDVPCSSFRAKILEFLADPHLVSYYLV